MGPAAYLRLSSASSSFVWLIACLLCAAGCHNTCISGTLNSPASTVSVTISNPPPSCSLSTANGAVRLEIGAASAVPSAPGATGQRIAHLFVTLEGVDVHSGALAAGDSPGWQPLASQLLARPLQVDLLADPHASPSSAPLSETVLPAGVYRQIRLRLATPPLAEPALETNRCGAGALHCAVMSDGRAWPVALVSPRPDLSIVLESTTRHGLYVPPDGVVTLRIELDRDRTFLWPAGDSLLLTPVFHLSVEPPPDISDNGQQGSH